MKKAKSTDSIFICNSCHSNLFSLKDDEFYCLKCRNTFQKVDGIWFFDKENINPEWEKVEKVNEILHDAYAEQYRRENEPTIFSDANYQKIKSNILAILKGISNPKILDIGCGTGFILKVCSEFSNILYGVDISLKMLKKAKDYGATLVKSSAASLPFQDNVFDLVTLNSTLHHLQDIEPVLREAYRVLSPGGCIYIDHDPNRGFLKYFSWYVWLRNKKKYGRRLSKKIYSSNKIGMNEIRLAEYQFLVKHGFSKEQLESALSKEGFSNIRIGFHFPRNPDRFTKILIFFYKIFPKDNFKYYIFAIAQK